MAVHPHESPERGYLRYVEHLDKQGVPRPEEVWQSIGGIARTAPSKRTQLRAWAMLADRLDPIPRASVTDGALPAQLTIAIVNTEHPARHALEGNGGGLRIRNSEREGP